MLANTSRLADFIRSAGRVAALTGAGVSTASGIPGYRDRDGNWQHPPPVQYQDFLQRAATRRRYWARSFAGWGRVAGAAPNLAHQALAALEHAGHIDTLITQNVDGLHGRAGSRQVIDLHGRLDAVVCLDCTARMPRDEWQQRLLAANPGWQPRSATSRPDGDAELDAADYDAFVVPGCPGCGGLVKPDVVFFGESVPRGRVADATSGVARSAALLVVGSSLMVYSGLRFVRQAVAEGKPVAILNQGRTRADDLAALRVDAECGASLAAVAAAMADGTPGDGSGVAGGAPRASAFTRH